MRLRISKASPLSVFSRITVTSGDVVVGLLITAVLYLGIRLALDAPRVLAGPHISLSLQALPWYAALSVGRMAAAYSLSLLFTLAYGYLAAYHRRAEPFLIAALDVLQSVPILSFLPVVLLSFTAVLPQGLAVELASIVLIFTSQVWNLTFGWYQALKTSPRDLREAATLFRFSRWLRVKTLDLPFAAIGLIWNSMMSWAGGWFFLMAAEMFTVGDRDFRLPGLGAYLKEAAAQGDLVALWWGLGTLVFVIVLLDQMVWRPLLAWADRFKLETVEGRTPPTSWLYEVLRTSRLMAWVRQRVWTPLMERIDQRFQREGVTGAGAPGNVFWFRVGLALVFAVAGGLLYGTLQAVEMLLVVPSAQWGYIASGLLATFLRVLAALCIAALWTIPIGVLIGTNPRAAGWLQPVVQVAASVPATALFPVILVLLLDIPGGLNLAAVFLMLMGTQWYLLFNTIGGAAAIPQDLKDTAALLQISRWDRWRILILPGLFPFLVTGAITATGGAWNASIVAEYVEFGGRTVSTPGIGALIAEATATGDYPLLLAGTLSMILTVVTVNRLVWRRLYRIAEERYRLE